MNHDLKDRSLKASKLPIQVFQLKLYYANHRLMLLLIRIYFEVDELTVFNLIFRNVDSCIKIWLHCVLIKYKKEVFLITVYLMIT